MDADDFAFLLPKEMIGKRMRPFAVVWEQARERGHSGGHALHSRAGL